MKDGSKRPMTELQEEYLAGLSVAERERLFPHGWKEGVVLECYDFLTAIRDGRAPEVDGATGMKAKAIAEAIYESGTTGQVVRMADVLSGQASSYQREIDERWGL
jgi:UDP-N-acetyl-2-amino-2-deoxyglucuronate dehydrogenase